MVIPKDGRDSPDGQRLHDAARVRTDAAPVIHDRRRVIDYVWNGLFVVALILAYLLVVQNPRWEWPIVWKYLFHKRVLEGLEHTIVLTILSSALGLCLGCLVAACRMASNRALQAFGYCYIWVIRATPTLVMLLFLFFLSALVPRVYIPLPFTDTPLIDISTTTLISRYSAAVLGLSLYLGGYSAEIFRSGLVSIDRGQREAAKAIGMSDLAMMLHIVIPQAVRVIIPPLSNELITMFKNTSLVTVIGYVELLTTVQQIYSTNFETIPLLTVACIWYLVLTSLAMLFQSMLEKRFGKGFSR
ncbi:amino acid ABC transporter permease [Robbsia sp. KACC 23696]|uniref:amino acid ABC transporter permease n=1 Tax=Robbsia sp. KACC 23696 TaxID=3149231 RepID=UPI00325BA393